MEAMLTLKIPAGDDLLRLRDEITEKISQVRAMCPDGVSIQGPDFHAFAKANQACEQHLKSAEARLVAAAKKLGLKPVGAPDVNYGVHGTWQGPVYLWFQIRAD